MGTKKNFSIRVDEDLLRRIDERHPSSRNEFIVEAIQDKLSGTAAATDITPREQRAILNAGKSLSDMMRDAMIDRMSKEQDLLDGLSREDFLKLVAARLPKDDTGDASLEREVLSLCASIDQLPATEDLTRELNRLQLKVKRLELERDAAQMRLDGAVGRAPVMAVADSIYRSAVSYCVELCARRGLPCFGDMAGESDAGMAEIAKEVERELKGLKL